MRGICCYCGLERGLTRDHLTPLSRGGLDEPENRAWACRPCNNLKGPMTEAEFREVMHDVKAALAKKIEIDKIVEAEFLAGLRLPSRNTRKRRNRRAATPPRLEKPDPLTFTPFDKVTYGDGKWRYDP